MNLIEEGGTEPRDDKLSVEDGARWKLGTNGCKGKRIDATPRPIVSECIVERRARGFHYYSDRWFCQRTFDKARGNLAVTQRALDLSLASHLDQFDWLPA